MTNVDLNYLTPLEARNSILFGNKLAAQLPTRSGFRFDAVTLFHYEKYGIEAAIVIAIKYYRGDRKPTMDEARQHVRRIAKNL